MKTSENPKTTTRGPKDSQHGTEIHCLKEKLTAICSIAKEFNVASLSVGDITIHTRPDGYPTMPLNTYKEEGGDGPLPVKEELTSKIPVEGMPSNDEMLMWSANGLADDIGEVR